MSTHTSTQHPHYPPRPAPPRPLRPIGAVAAIIGAVAALAWIVPVPVICYPIPAALGAIGTGVAIVSAHYERGMGTAAIIGLAGGLAGLAAGLVGYDEYTRVLGSFPGA